MLCCKTEVFKCTLLQLYNTLQLNFARQVPELNIITANQIVGKYHKKPMTIQSSPRKLLKVHENASDQFGFILASDWLKGQRKFP